LELFDPIAQILELCICALIARILEEFAENGKSLLGNLLGKLESWVVHWKPGTLLRIWIVLRYDIFVFAVAVAITVFLVLVLVGINFNG
jgi:hypothetical protein